jgi:cytochrome b involved in lipid metabolism
LALRKIIFIGRNLIFNKSDKNMKNLTTISIFIFGVVVTSILTAGLVFYQNNNQLQNGVGNQGGSGNQTGSIVLDMTEIAKHNSVQSCWLLINNKVYDVTSYFGMHPGGAQTILPTCGQDATTAYATKGRNNGRDHSSQAYSLLTQYYIGDFKQTINNSASGKTNNTSQASATTNTQTTNKTPTTAQPSTTVEKSTSLTLTSAEVAKHNTTGDCWMIISNKVYNVTSAMNSHPGGVTTILNYCGQDGTQGFATKDIGRNHSGTAYSLLANYYLGDLNQSVTSQSLQNTPATPPLPGGDEFEDD